MEQILVPAEWYHHVAPRLPMPEYAYGLCFDEHKDVLLVYEDIEKHNAAVKPRRHKD